uniref:Sperm associated antigen 1 n=1 Tax=Tetraodon nigroviridis TaxID=99883 RepID=H3D704_TETNG
KVPVEHLNYDYIRNSKDAKYLEKVLAVLRSGDEGIYPHLIRFCETHLEKLDPRSRALRRENPVATATCVQDDEWRQIVDDLMTWEKDMKMAEASQQQQQLFVAENIPPVRGSNCPVSFCKNPLPKKGKSSSKHPRPRDYREWDKFDVETECEKINQSVKNEPPAKINNSCLKIKTQVDASLLTEREKLHLANNEKILGNEAFVARDYEEAVAYYSRSLSIIPTVAAYNNRAQAEIKLQHWHRALKDCQSVLELEAGNIKALLRRATAYHHMDQFQMAAEDLRVVLKEEPNNPAATKLLTETEKKLSESQPVKQSKRIIIQEVEEEDHSKARPVELTQPVGGEKRSAAPADRGDMGNAQKKPHGRGGGGPHPESNNTHHGHWKSRGSSDQSPEAKGPSGGATAGATVDLDAPSGALPPPLARLKNEGNLLFKNGQFAEALEKYSAAIRGYGDSGIDSPEDLCILHSNRAACYLKDGNSQDCIQDCTKALELQPFSLKPLLRRAMAYESLERYRKAYVDYKTVLQIDTSVQAAHDAVNRITRVLIDQDGADWREKLPDIPLVPLSAQQHRREEPPSAEALKARAEREARDAERRAEVRFGSLKQEGNDFVKKGQYQDALGKYTDCLTLKPGECAIYTNRALCFLKLERFADAKQDCDAALKLEPNNKKAFYRRALAHKGLKDYLACSSDLQEVLQLDPNVQEAEKELEEVTALLRESLARASPAKARKSVPIAEVEDDEETPSVPNSDSSCKEDELSVNLHPRNAYEFGQALSAACSSGNTAAGADLLTSTAPETLPQLLSSQLDAQTIIFIMQSLDSHLLHKDPNLVYQHLNYLHTTKRFLVAQMMLKKEERHLMAELFEHLSAVESSEFSRNDVQNLANKYI